MREREFTRATDAVPREPAAWANLGLAHLRLGEFDAAAEPIERALALAPDERRSRAAGRADGDRARAARSGPRAPEARGGARAAGLRPRFALAEEVERAGGRRRRDAQAQALLDELVTLAPDNLAVLVERARVAAKRATTCNAGRFDRPSRAARGALAAAGRGAVSASSRQAVGGERPCHAHGDDPFLRNVLARVPAFART